MHPKDHNNPPEVLELAQEVISSVSTVMADVPVVQDENDARAMKLQIDRAKLCVKDLEGERDGKVRPLNDQVGHINAMYRTPKRLLLELLDEMLIRLQLFVKTEEIRREAIAKKAAAEAAEAAVIARIAEHKERERLDDAQKGELGVDVAAVIADADAAFEDYQRAERAAILAKKETHVKIGGGISRAIGLKVKETLSVIDPVAAVSAMGMTLDIKEAILKSARAYRKALGKLPIGVTSTEEKEL